MDLYLVFYSVLLICVPKFLTVLSCVVVVVFFYDSNLKHDMMIPPAEFSLHTIAMAIRIFHTSCGF